MLSVFDPRCPELNLPVSKTAILVSHSMGDVEQLCDRVAVIREGRIAFTGPLGELTRGRDALQHHSEHTGEALEDALQPLYAGASYAGASS